MKITPARRRSSEGPSVYERKKGFRAALAWHGDALSKDMHGVPTCPRPREVAES